MEIFKMLMDFFLHIDKNLAVITAQYGMLTYGILFLVIFMETGFVVTPFLPGDSLLFAAGALAAMGSFEILILYALMLLAAVAGDTANYWMGSLLGREVFDGRSKFFKKAHLDQAEKFYEKHGGKAIVLARFVPIVRTFAPFVAGVSKMHYGKFISYNIVGGVAWVSLFTFGGFWFGNIPFVKDNFHYVVLAIILISVVPIVLEVMKAGREKRKRVE
ncbi:MAG: DedA protein [uncultured bacterium]|nr:MAG: DedA protein [uncultured bacterium]